MENKRESVKELILVDLISKSEASVKEYMVAPKNWGHEIIIINSDNYCMKTLNIYKNRMCSIHYHRVKDETFLVVKGNIRIEFWGPDIDLVEFDKNKPDHIMTLWPGSSVHVPVKTAHRFTAVNEDAQIIEVSTHHLEEDSVRLVPSPKYGE